MKSNKGRKRRDARHSTSDDGLAEAIELCVLLTGDMQDFSLVRRLVEHLRICAQSDHGIAAITFVTSGPDGCRVKTIDGRDGLPATLQATRAVLLAGHALDGLDQILRQNPELEHLREKAVELIQCFKERRVRS